MLIKKKIDLKLKKEVKEKKSQLVSQRYKKSQGKYCNQYAYKLNEKEMHKFLEIHNFPRLNQEEIYNL